MKFGNKCKRIMLTAGMASFIFTGYSQKIIGYATSWSGTAESIHYSNLSHINYAFALPGADGHLRPLENTAKLQSVVDLAHQAGVRVSISVGGWSDENGPLDGTFESIASVPAYRNNLVQDIADLVTTYNLDGADIDWEYPDGGSSAANFDSLMTELYDTIHPRGKLVTAAVAGESYNGAGIDLYVKNVVDWINIMAYDYSDYQHSTYDQSITGVQYYENKGFPREQLALGVPFYGRNSWESYAQLVARGADPYMDTYSGVGYNGITTIVKKSNYVKSNGLAGIMIWELSQDLDNQYSLLSSIYGVFGPTNVPGEDKGTDIKLYPNPSAGLISVSSKTRISRISIFNLQGMLVYQIRPDASDATMDISVLPAGVYFLKLKIRGEEKNLRIVRF